MADILNEVFNTPPTLTGLIGVVVVFWMACAIVYGFISLLSWIVDLIIRRNK